MHCRTYGSIPGLCPLQVAPLPPRVTTKNASRHGGNMGKMVLGNYLEVPESTTGGITRLFHEPIPINHCTCHANNQLPQTNKPKKHECTVWATNLPEEGEQEHNNMMMAEPGERSPSSKNTRPGHSLPDLPSHLWPWSSDSELSTSFLLSEKTKCIIIIT